MSISLIVEVLDHAPADLTSGERLVLIVIAEWANEKTREARQSNGWTLDTICHRAGIKRSGLKSVLQGLARKGLEVRVPVKFKDGKPIYAYEGTALTFRVPELAQRGGHSIPTQDARGDATASERGGHSIQEGWSQPPPSPQGSPLKKNPSSLSGEAATDPGPAVVTAQPEREIEEASQNPKNGRRGTAYSVLALEGVTDDEADRFIAWANQSGHKGGGWYRTVADNGDLTGHVEAFRAQDSIASSCTVCDDTGEVGDYLNRHPCACIWWKDEPAAIAAFKVQLRDMEPCPDGVSGGNIEAPNGWRLCARCRGKDWVAKNLQPAGELLPKNRRYEPFRPVADQSAYDRPFSGQIHSPADQRVAEAQPLYDHYRRLELEGESA